jgi:ketose-bisphosphate aldolase
MALVTSKELLDAASEGGYAIGMFDFHNIETLEAIFDAAENRQSPVIIGVVTPLLHRVNIEETVGMARSLAMRATVPCAVHIDHGRTLEVVVKGMVAGVTSVMFDGSATPLDENIRTTSQVVEIARTIGVSTEAELGYVGFNRDDTVHNEIDSSRYTEVEEAITFSRETGVDMLAIAVGTVHGIYKQKPNIDFPRIQAIHELDNVHLVLHGASGIPVPDIKKAISCGIRKINYFTELACAAHSYLQDRLAEDTEPVPFYKYMPGIRSAVQAVVEQILDVLGSAGRA